MPEIRTIRKNGPLGFEHTERRAGLLAQSGVQKASVWISQPLEAAPVRRSCDVEFSSKDTRAASPLHRAAAKAARTYLDYNATAPLCPEAKAAMIAALECAGNPSSVHAEGRRARALVETAREQVAALVGAKPSEVVFTSGATEANAWALAQPYDSVFVCDIEHDSVLANTKGGRAAVIPIPVGTDGVAAIETVAAYVMSGKALGRALVTLQMANNETGVIQSVADLASFARDHGLRVHTDAVQAVGRIAIDFRELGVDTLALSAHKMGGPKGVGALVIRDGFDLLGLIRGGGQERRRRAGTENVAAIAGFGAAAVVAVSGLQDVGRIAALRDHLEASVRAAGSGAIVIGANAPRLANTSLLALKGKSAENLIIKLDLAGISVSAGSACSSGKGGSSHVLTAMGLDPEIASSAIRVSLGPETTENDIAAFLAVWTTIAKQPALAA